MKKAAIVGLLVCAGALASVQYPSIPPSRTRQVPYHEGRDIVALLGESDGSLEIVMWVGPPLASGEGYDPLTEAELLTRYADAVCRLRVLEKHAHLTPARDWIDSVVETQVVDVLKESVRQPLTPGQRISFPERGGTLIFDRRRTIIASVSEEAAMVKGREYLVFLNQYPDGTWARPRPWMTFAIAGPVLRRMRAHQDGMGLAGLRLVAAARHVRAAAHLPRPKPGGR